MGLLHDIMRVIVAETKMLIIHNNTKKTIILDVQNNTEAQLQSWLILTVGKEFLELIFELYLNKLTRSDWY